MNQVYASSAFPVASPEGRRMGPCPLVPQMKVAMSKHKGLRQENTQLSNCTDYNFLTSISKTLLICMVVDVSFGLEMTRNSMFQRVSPHWPPPGSIYMAGLCNPRRHGFLLRRQSAPPPNVAPHPQHLQFLWPRHFIEAYLRVAEGRVYKRSFILR